MTTAFKTVITRYKSGSFHRILVEMRSFLRSRHFTQVPQLSSEHFLDLTACFLPDSEPVEVEPIKPPLRTPVRKALTIGINYLNLPTGQGRLAGCINDSDTMMDVLQDTFRFNTSQIQRLRDDDNQRMPTKDNMIAAFRWLVEGAASGDEMFLHYSGHGGTIDDTELVNGLVFDKGAKKTAGGPTHVKDAKIGLIQFCLSAPKSDMENNVVVSDYAAMDRILREERKYILGLCKKIKKAGCTVVLIQKSILRDAYNDLSLHFLAKMGIMVITDIERNDIDFISRSLNCMPVAHVDSFTADKLGSAELCNEVTMPGGTQRVVKVTGVANPGRTCTILVRGTNKLTLDEADRSIHDALCVVRSLVKKRFLISGGGVAETELALKLGTWAKEQTGMKAYCVRAYAEALEIVPFTLAENAGLNPINIVTELRKQHAEGNTDAGINVRRNCITNMSEENVIQPLLVNTSAITLATECVCMILKIDDVVPVR